MTGFYILVLDPDSLDKRFSDELELLVEPFS